MVSDATSDEDKSYVSTNFAVVMENAAKQELLVDSDMRLGFVHGLLHQ